MGRLKVVSFITKCVAAGVIIASTLLSIWTVGPTVETAFFPVVSKLHVARITQDAEGNAVVYVEFTKLRNCEYLGLSWFKGSPGGFFERVRVTLGRMKNDDSSPNRPTGKQFAGPWTVAMSKEDLEENSFAQLNHRCHPFWMTTTDFYP